jgi:membrane-associated protein
VLAPLVLAVQLAHHHGSVLDYAGIALAAFISWIGVSGPGEAVLIGAGLLAARGRLDLASVLAAAWLGATLGGTGGWLIGRHGGRPVVLAGRRLHAPRRRALEHGRRFFDRYGVLAVYFAPSWVAGLNAMPPGRFVPANAVSALVWALFIGLGAYVLGPSIRDIAVDVGLYGSLAIVVLALVGVVVLGRRRLARWRRGGGAGASDDGAGA